MSLGTPIEDLHFEGAPDVGDVPGPESRRLFERQREIESGAVSYPRGIPIAYDEGRGTTVRDADGNCFLDFFSTIGVLNLGHAHPYLTEAATDQMEKAVHTLDFPTEARLDLIEALDLVAPGDLPGNNRVIFGGPMGSDAVEATIKLAKYNTGGHSLLSFRGAYHGSTAGAQSITAQRDPKAHYAPMLPDAHFLPYPYPFRQDKSDEEAVEDALAELRAALEDPWSGITDPAGIWVEPMQGSGGMVVPPEGFLAGVREIADEHSIPMVVDEIQAGFGRTGEWWACEHAGVTPDAVTVAKGIGGVGLPLSATIYHEDLDTWDAGDHVGTFRGNLPAMRAGVRAIEYVREHDLLDHATEIGEHLRERLRAARSSYLGEVRGEGLFIGAEFVDGAGEPLGEMAREVRTECYENGVLIWTAGRGGNVLRIMPPLVTTREQAEVGADVMVEAIETVAGRR